MELSLNEVESLAAKAARGAGFSWGLAEDVGRAARALAREGESWSEPLIALLTQSPEFEPPSARRIALWRAGEADERGEKPLCPVRAAALLNDAPPLRALRLRDVGLPVWLDALLRMNGRWRVVADLGAARADATVIPYDEAAAAPMRRAPISRESFEALNAFASLTYVPESERSRARGAGGGRVDDE